MNVRLCCWLLLFSSALATAQSQTPYAPFTIENATWVIFDNEGFYAPVGYDGSYVLRISGDSTVNGTTYKKLYAANFLHPEADFARDVSPPYTIDSFTLYGLVRDDTTARRFSGILPTYDNPGNTEEVLIHDFGTNIGEPMRGAFKQEEAPLTAVHVDTIYGRPRLTHLPPREDMPTYGGIGTAKTGPLCQNPTVAINAGERAIISYCIGSPADCELRRSTVNTATVRTPTEELHVFPNPVARTQLLEVRTSMTIGTAIRIHDARGRLALSTKTIGGLQQLDISKLSPGIYYLQVGRRVRRIVVQ